MTVALDMTVRTKLVYVIDVLDTNLAGTENQLIKMINGLDKGKFDVHLLCFHDHEWFRRNGGSLDCAKTIIEINRFKKPSTYWNILRLIRFFQKLQPDIVHTFFPVANIVGVIAARLAGVRAVVSSRRDYGEWMSDGYLTFTRLANRFASLITTNSNSVKTLTVNVEGVPVEKVEVIYNGLDIRPFAQMKRDLDLKRRLGIPEGHRVVGVVANFRPMKRHDTFVRAAHEVLKQYKDVDFVLVGGILAGQTPVEALGHSLGISERLHFVGMQEDIVPYLSIMDIGVNCSEREGQSNAIMEYMAAGVPCIVAASGGNPDLITHNVHGLTFPLGDHRTLAERIITLLENDALAAEFARRARNKADAELTVSAMLSRYENSYRRLAASGVELNV